MFMHMNSTQAKARADILKALAHPTRVLMLDALSRGDRCVNDLRILASVSQPTISHHLEKLKKVGIVTERRAGKQSHPPSRLSLHAGGAGLHPRRDPVGEEAPRQAPSEKRPMNKELKILLGLLAAFLGLYYLPMEHLRFQGAIIEAFKLAKWYAREHVLLCLVPAFFIAGAIGVFVSQNAVMKYFGPKASKGLSYGVASVSGTILAVCSCTVLPLFGGIYMRGAGLGPAIAFLYSGPAINVLAIVLTARVLGWQLGVARAVGAIVFSVVIGLLMHLIFLKEERAKAANPQDVFIGDDEKGDRPLWQVALYFLSMVGILVFANWAQPQETAGVWFAIFKAKWIVTALFAVLMGFCLWRFFKVRLAWIALAAVPAVVLAFALPGYPVAAFAAGSAGLAGADVLRRRRTQGLARPDVGLRQADPAAAVHGRAGGRLLPRQPRQQGCGHRPESSGFRRSSAIRRRPCCPSWAIRTASPPPGLPSSGRCGPTSSPRSPAR